MAIVSIIVPCFNAESLVAETIESVLAQSVRAWELLLVNDGSRDGTKDVLARYARRDDRIRILDLKSNLGIPAARNLGTVASVGQYLMHLDADDLLEASALQAHLDVVREASVSYAGYSSFDNLSPEPLETFLGELPDDALLAMLTTGADKGRWWIPPGAMLVRKSADEAARRRFEVWPKQVQTLTESHYYACLYRSGATFAPTKSVELRYRKHPASDGATAGFFSLAAGYRWMLEFWLKELGDHPELLRRKALFFKSLRVAANVEAEFSAKYL